MNHQLFTAYQTPTSDEFFIQYIICICCAIISAFAISPIVTIVDKSVIKSSNAKQPLVIVLQKEVKKIISGSLKFWMNVEFQWVFAVYVMTYATSNLSTKILQNCKWIDPLVGKLLLTFVVNSTASMIKDKALAQRLGKSQTRQFPVSALGLFFLRDLLAMSSAFTLPYFLSFYFQTITDLSPNTSLYFCQLLSPALNQIFTTFIQLLTLDFYNRQNQSFVSRIKQVKKSYFSSLLVRIVGFTIAYGLGGVVNFQAKRHLEGIFW